MTATEFFLLFTENNNQDKKIAENNFINWFIRNKNCKNKKDMIKDIIRVSNLYLNNTYISANAKKEIYQYVYMLK